MDKFDASLSQTVLHVFNNLSVCAVNETAIVLSKEYEGFPSYRNRLISKLGTI